MIGLSKKPLVICHQVKGKFETHFWQFVESVGSPQQGSEHYVADVTNCRVRLHLRHRLCKIRQDLLREKKALNEQASSVKLSTLKIRYIISTFDKFDGPGLKLPCNQIALPDL